MTDIRKQVRYHDYDTTGGQFPPTSGNHTDKNAIERVNKLPEEIREYVWTNDPCWSYVPSGWRELVVQLHNSFVQVAPEYRITQAKEKFGGLRFYTNIAYSGESLASKIIEHYEMESYKTCDVCGKSGEIRNIQCENSNFRFLATRCGEHNEDKERTK